MFTVCIGIAFLSMSLGGCSFNASASFNTKSVLEGKDVIRVKAAQPEAPPEPPPPVKFRKAKVVGNKIVITEKVMFDTAKASIKSESEGLLNDVASVIKEHKGIKKIRIEGHTDSDGKDKYNKKLSQNRADSVKDFLVNIGIDAGMLEAVGYGEEKPIASNDTNDGKEKNRRVEFNILDDGK